MPLGPENSAIKLTPEQEKYISTLTAEQIKPYMATLAVQNGLATRDFFNPDILHETELSKNSPARLAKAITINGVKHILEADSETALLAAENDLMRQIFEQAATETQGEPPRDAAGRFVSEADAATIAERADLEAKFRRGEIDSATYLQRSGAIAEYLEEQGISLADLREQTTEKQAEQFQKSWSDATTEFLNGAGADWPGGTQNMETIGKILEENNLTAAEDKVGALEAAYQFARENNLLVENPEVRAAQEQAEQIRNAQTADEVRNILHGGERSSTSFFDR